MVLTTMDMIVMAMTGVVGTGGAMVKMALTRDFIDRDGCIWLSNRWLRQGQVQLVFQWATLPVVLLPHAATVDVIQ